MTQLDESYILANMPSDLSAESLDIYAEQLCAIEPKWTESPPGTWTGGSLDTRLARMVASHAYAHDDCLQGALRTLMHKVMHYYAAQQVECMQSARQSGPHPA